MELKECTKEYWEFVRVLRNDKRVLDGFIQSTYITKEMQEKYMPDNFQFFIISLSINFPIPFP